MDFGFWILDWLRYFPSPEFSENRGRGNQKFAILNQKLLIVCLCQFAGFSVLAQPAEPVATIPAASEEIAAPASGDLSIAEDLKRRDRDPFWPFDYKKAAPGASTNRTSTGIVTNLPPPVPTINDWVEAQKKLKIDGFVSQRAQRFAIINGSMCRQGDVLGVRYEGYLYRFRVKAVDGKSVRFEKLNRKFVAVVEKKEAASGQP